MNMANIATIGRLTPRISKEKARTAQSSSDHAVAISWWSPSSLPSCLNEKCYVQMIQPLLTTIKVREIADTPKVSLPYAALIRLGRRRPHPRHWQALAEPAGVSSQLS